MKFEKLVTMDFTLTDMLIGINDDPSRSNGVLFILSVFSFSHNVSVAVHRVEVVCSIQCLVNNVV